MSLTKPNNIETQKKSSIKDKVYDFLKQNSSANEELRSFYNTLRGINKQLLNSWYTNYSGEIDDDTYRVLIKLKSFFEKDTARLETKLSKMRTAREKAATKAFENTLKTSQYEFLKKSYDYLISDLQNLQKKWRNESIQYLANNPFPKDPKYAASHTSNLTLFLGELPSFVNTLDELQKRILDLVSNDTKEYITNTYK